MTLPRFAVEHYGCMDEQYQCSRKLLFRHYYLWLFLQVALSHTPPLRVQEVHKRGIIIHITESKIHISYSENHDSTLLFDYFYISPLPALGVVIFWLVLSFDITKLQKKCLNVLSTGIFPFPMSMDKHPLWRWGLNLDLNDFERVIHLSVPENYSFESIIGDYFYRHPFTTPPFTGATGAHKRHQGNIYSYHRVQNSYQLFKTLWFNTNFVFYYFYLPLLLTLVHIVAKGW